MISSIDRVMSHVFLVPFHPLDLSLVSINELIHPSFRHLIYSKLWITSTQCCTDMRKYTSSRPSSRGTCSSHPDPDRFPVHIIKLRFVSSGIGVTVTAPAQGAGVQGNSVAISPLAICGNRSEAAAAPSSFTACNLNFVSGSSLLASFVHENNPPSGLNQLD